MQLVEFKGGDVIFNWQELPEKVRSNLDLRDKIFNELKEKFKVDTIVDSRCLFEMNQYVINRLKSKIK